MKVQPRRSGLVCLAALSAPSPAQEIDWLKQIGSPGADFLSAIVTNGSDDVFIAGQTTGKLGGEFFGNYDIWVSRRDSVGNEVWTRQIGTQGNESNARLQTDGAGGYYLAGRTEGSLGGPNLGKDDAFIARYDADGKRLWMVQFGTPQSDVVTAMVSAAHGGVYVAGTTTGGLGGPNQGGQDVWIARFDPDGHRLWDAQIGSPVNEGDVCLGYDALDAVYIAGWTLGDLGGPNQGLNDVFLAHYTPQGAQDWLIQFGTDSFDVVGAAGADGLGSGVLLTGFTMGDLGGPQQGEGDAWAARYDDDGNQAWISQFGTPDGDAGLAVVPAGGGRAMVGGYTAGDFGGSNAGVTDAWVARLDHQGGVSTVTQFGTPASEAAVVLSLDGRGEYGAFVGGQTEGSLGGPHQGNGDAWFGHTAPPASCYPDFDHSGKLDLFDFLAFIGRFNNAEPQADCTGDGILDIFDFLCFVNVFNDGC